MEGIAARREMDPRIAFPGALHGDAPDSKPATKIRWIMRRIEDGIPQSEFGDTIRAIITRTFANEILGHERTDDVKPTRYTSPKRVAALQRRFLDGLENLAEVAERGVDITLTLDPEMHNSLLDGWDGIVAEVDKLNNKMKKWCGERPPYVARVEIQDRGWPHLHIIYAGVTEDDIDTEDLKSWWATERDRGRQVAITPVRESDGRWYYDGFDDEQDEETDKNESDADEIMVRTYLGGDLLRLRQIAESTAEEIHEVAENPEHREEATTDHDKTWQEALRLMTGTKALTVGGIRTGSEAGIEGNRPDEEAAAIADGINSQSVQYQQPPPPWWPDLAEPPKRPLTLAPPLQYQRHRTPIEDQQEETDPPAWWPDPPPDLQQPLVTPPETWSRSSFERDPQEKQLVTLVRKYLPTMIWTVSILLALLPFG